MRIGLNFLARSVGLGLVGAPAAPSAGSPGARLSVTPAALWAAFRDRVTAEEERWFPWAVAAFGTGAALYFALPDEPGAWLVPVGAGLGLVLLIAAWRSPIAIGRFAAVVAAALILGLGAAKLRAERVAAPILPHDVGPVTMSGRIESAQIQDATHARIVLVPSRLGRATHDLPARVRLTLRGAKAVAAARPGTHVSLLAALRPPPGPVMPGGYDFGRRAYFEGIGGTGYTLGAPRPAADAPPDTWRQRLSAAIDRLRLSVAARIEAELPGPNGAIAAALVTGERAAISDEDNAAYRDSGLAHVLSISGLHMALAGLGIFWLVRALLAAFPALALAYPVKKWAAVAAFAGATFYLFLSGAGAPAVRSYLMLSAMLLAVLADRPALNMRAVALSALIILAFEPESVIEPSFQMSFAAIVGLIALAEWQRGRRRGVPPPAGVPGRMLFRLRRYLVGLTLVSIVAGLATAPFAIYHFDRAPGYSLLANLLAMPVVSLVVMPSACLTVASLPFGLEHFPLQAMGWGVGVMTGIAHWVAALPGAVNVVQAWSSSVLILIAAGGLWTGLWQRRWRWLGLGPIAAGVMLGLTQTPPDVLMARDGAGAAVRGAGGLILLGQPDDYTAEQWLLRDGDPRMAAAARAGAHCDEWGCVAHDRGGHTVSLALRAGALPDDCARADLVLSAVPVRVSCAHPMRVVDRFDVLDQGAMAFWFSDGGVRALGVAAERGVRPWSEP